jgi:uncharacterized SAM-binding protein YcdF (DUF218 family)
LVKRRIRGIKLMFKALQFALVLLVVWTGYVQWMIHSIEQQEVVEQTEVGIVLGAALWNNAPSPALKERLNRAISLYEEGLIKHIIVTGGMDYNGSTWSEAEGMQHYLVEQGIPNTAIKMEMLARSTYENLLFSQDIMEREQWVSAVIITHDYHAARARDTALFLNYKEPVMSSMDSKVMYMPYHKGRETLAYTKWTLDKLILSFKG